MKYDWLFLSLCLPLLSGISAELKWTFPADHAEWTALRNVKCIVRDDGLLLSEIKRDSQVIHRGLQIRPDDFNVLSITYRATGIPSRTTGQLFFATAETKGKFKQNNQWRIPSLKGDGKWHTLLIPPTALHPAAEWRAGNTVTDLRLDMTDQPGGEITIKEIRLFFDEKLLNALSLDEPKWPPVKPEFIDFPEKVTGEPYFNGYMIKSPDDRQDKLPGTFYLRREFLLQTIPRTAYLQIAADDEAEIYLNGINLLQNSSWRTVSRQKIPDGILKKGMNIWAIKYKNQRSAGGVLGELFLRFPDGTYQKLPTDRNFLAAAEEIAGWLSTECDKSSWKPAIEQKPAPASPWTEKLEYTDFQDAEQEGISFHTDKTCYTAGEKLYFTGRFKGNMPQNMFPISLKLHNSRNKIIYRNTLQITKKDLHKIDGEHWELKFSFYLPVYLRYAKDSLTLSIHSFAFYCASGKKPEAVFTCRNSKDKPQNVTAKIKKTPYGPVMNINGKNVFPLWGAVYKTPESVFGPAPLNVRTVYPYLNPGKNWWKGIGQFDFDYFDYCASETLRNNPDAYLVWDLHLEPPEKWAEKFTGELSRLENGNITRCRHYICYSFASAIALNAMKHAMVQAIRHVENSSYAHRVIGYRICGGNTLEWLGWDPEPGHMTDYSDVAQQAFIRFSGREYGLELAGIPSMRERKATDNGAVLYMQPGKHLSVIAHNDFQSRIIADMFLELCRTAKKELHGNKLVGGYFGYTAHLPSSGQSNYRGHYALNRVLNSGAVDFLISPISYSIRYIGETANDMKPYTSMMAHNILPVLEDDSRTHNSPSLYARGYPQSQTLSLQQSISVARRNAGIALCRNYPLHYLALITGTEFNFPQMGDDLAVVRAVGEYCVENNIPRQSEIAVVYSEETVKRIPYLEKNSDPFRIRQIYRGDGTVQTYKERARILTGVIWKNAELYPRIGAPIDILLAEDLPNAPQHYKLYIFPDSFYWTPEFQNAIDKLKEKNVTMLWLYAPGFAGDRANSLENMTKLTGFKFELLKNPLEPITYYKSQRLGIGPEITPVFRIVNTGKETVMGKYVNTDYPALAMTKHGRATSVFSGPFLLNDQFLRELAEQSGIHLYSRSSDPFEANRNFLILHARSSGKKKIHLPEEVDIVDVFSKKIIAENTDVFEFNAELHSSYFFYYGKDTGNLLKKLAKSKSKGLE